ncbi:MAG TPA: hypothetical protein VJA18_02025 [Candidatus Nanoarchaeia archaeon]|nr:hypothetical protein [Candidatus Nanoarchaeia archaeon]
MLISFFEEFPIEENLAKLKLVSWPTKIYIAADSLQQFKAVTSVVRHNQNLLEAVYWPILKKKEGYWISPFSKQSALQHLFDELEHKKVPVMLDLELPTTRNPWLYLTEFLNFKKDKKLIHSFVCNHPGETYLCEYYAKPKLLELLGLHYQNKQSKVMKMFYNSVHHFDQQSLRNQLQQGLQQFGDRFIVGYGTIAIGIGGNEPLLSAEQLEKDLHLAQEVGVKEVVLFRLGGLNKKYVKVLEKFV